jgi:membrane-anchored protein YejM (alkaline phosphatase superfamily)
MRHDAPSGRTILLRWAGWFWFLVATAAMVVGIKYPLAAGFPQSGEGTLFFALLTLSHWYILFFLFLPLLFLPLTLLLPRPLLIRTLGWVLAVVSLVLVTGDAFSFSLFRFHLNGLVFSLLFSGAGGEIFVFDAQVYLLALLGLVMLGALVWWFNRLAWRLANRRSPRGHGYRLTALIVVSFLAQNGWFAWADATGNSDITAQARLYPVYMPTRAERTFRELGWINKHASATRVHQASGVVKYPLSPLSCHVGGENPNIFFLLIDSWRYDELNSEVTPHIDAFRQEAIEFPRHYSGGNNTRTGLFSLFYGIPATYWESFLDARAGAVLVNEARDVGYRMEIFASAKLTAPEFDRTIFSGIKGLRKETQADGAYVRDVQATREFIDVLKQPSAGPHFGMLFLDGPHAYDGAPKFRQHFQPAAEAMNYLTLNNETDPLPLRNFYRNTVISSDELIGQSLQAIRDAGLWDNSIIIVSADHGQEFNDNGLGFWGHNGNFTDAQIRVPFLVKWPGRGHEVLDYATTHYDIVPTLMQQVFGCDNPVGDYSVGHSLFSDQPRDGFVVGGFGDFGMRQKQRITWVDKFGGIQVMSDTNRPLDESPNPQLIKQAIGENSQYLK